jgi:hypothetical protein
VETDTDAEIYRLKVRLSILEGILIRIALTGRASTDRPHVEASAMSLRSFLETNAGLGFQVIGSLGNPALTALYGDEAEAVHRSVVANVDATLAQILRGS